MKRKLNGSPGSGKPHIAGHRSAGRTQGNLQSSDTSGQWKFSEHLLAFSGVAVLGAVGVKIIRVSHQDLTTALTIATQSSPSTILLGSVLLFFPALAPGLLLLAYAASRRLHRLVRGSQGSALAFLLLLAYLFIAVMIVVCAMTVPAAYFLAMMAIVPTNALARALTKRIRAHLPVRNTKKRAGRSAAETIAEALFVVLLAAGLAPLVYQAANDIVWLPPLEVHVRGQNPAFIGYEISSTSSRVTILRDSDRQVLFIDPKDIMSERPCERSDLVNDQRSLFAVLSHAAAPRTPRCISQP